jgi:sugar/nucleoside kinase (ribokinase family)
MRVAPLSASDLAPARGAQATLVNMISGRDVASATLAELRRGERGSFLLDVQALARSTDTPRRPRVVPDAPAWCRVFDVVRGSETEIAHFGGAPGDPRSAAARILSAGAGEVLATRGERGSVRYVLAGGELQRAEVAAVPCRAPVDPTGCGDSFLSGVCAGRILGLSALESLRLGSFVASRVLALAGLEALAALRTIRREALDYEPAWSSVFAEGPGARRPPPGSR